MSVHSPAKRNQTLLRFTETFLILPEKVRYGKYTTMAAVMLIVAPEIGELEMLRLTFLMLSARPWKRAAPMGNRMFH